MGLLGENAVEPEKRRVVNPHKHCDNSKNCQEKPSIPIFITFHSPGISSKDYGS